MIKTNLVSSLLSAVCAFTLLGCGGSGDSPTTTSVATTSDQTLTTSVTEEDSSDEQTNTSPFNTLDSASSITVSADGPNYGLRAYELIESAFATGR